MAPDTPDPEKKPEGSALPFASHIRGLKDKIAQLTEDRRMGADMLFLNTYMASLAIANASRPEIFAYASNRKEYISARYITKVDMFVKRWNYSLLRSPGYRRGTDEEYHPQEHAQPVCKCHRLRCPR